MKKPEKHRGWPPITDSFLNKGVILAQARIQNVFSGLLFGFAQGGESFDSAQDREPVERPVEPRPVPE